MGTALLIASGISLVLLAGGILFFLGAFWAWREWSNLLQHLVTIEGHITSRKSRDTTTWNDERRTNQTRTVYSVTYSYEYEGEQYVRESEITKKHHKEWKQGMKVTVRLPSNKPGDGSLVAEANLLGDTALIWGFGLAGLVCFGFAYLVFVLVAR